MARTVVEVERRRKRKDRRKRQDPKLVDIRPMIGAITIEALEPGSCTLRMALETVEGVGAKGREVRVLLEVPPDAVSLRLQTRFIDEMPLADMSTMAEHTLVASAPA
jgi:hypothetical protein